LKEILLATRNEDKVKEISAIMAGLPIRLRTLREFPDLPEVIEDGKSFEENASKKALAISRGTGLPALADDSGLVVPALGGEPGIFSSRYAGEGVTYEQNWKLLLSKMENVPEENRVAYFVCVAVLGEGEKAVAVAEGRCQGKILRGPKGEGGFGYDPVFLYPPSGLTFAELPGEEKNRVSHRALAMKKIRDLLEDRLRS
jgi:XTP/dITP diphosphohydrolase